MPANTGWPELLEGELAFAVLRKGNRLQVLLRPTAKQLRRRGKRNWVPVAIGRAEESGDGRAPLPQQLRDAVLGALDQLACAAQEGGGKKKKKTKKGRRKSEGGASKGGAAH